MNFAKRSQSANLSGRTFVITGGRIKIGFQIALKLLRAGAAVVATTRFAHDAAFRYSQELDCRDWIDRLRIHSADFRSLRSVESMCEQIRQEHAALDGLINNAAQTVRRPPEYYRHLIDREQELRGSLTDVAQTAIADQTGAAPRGEFGAVRSAG